jgi:hypothetical protein
MAWRTKTEPKKARTIQRFALSALEKSPEIADNHASDWIARTFARKNASLVALRPAVGAVRPGRPQLHLVRDEHDDSPLVAGKCIDYPSAIFYKESES